MKDRVRAAILRFFSIVAKPSNARSAAEARIEWSLTAEDRREAWGISGIVNRQPQIVKDFLRDRPS